MLIQLLRKKRYYRRISKYQFNELNCFERNYNNVEIEFQYFD